MNAFFTRPVTFQGRAFKAAILAGALWTGAWLLRDFIGGPPRLLDFYILWSIELVAITLDI